MQTAISLEDNRDFIGREVEVLVEGQSRSTARNAKDGTASTS